METYDQIIRVGTAGRVAGLLLVVLAAAGCGAEAVFPDEVPRRSGGTWIDAPLEAQVDGELRQIREVVAEHLARRRDVVCGPGGARARERDRLEAVRQASARVEHAIGQGSRHMEHTFLAPGPVEYQVRGFEARESATEPLLKWQCLPRTPDRACYEQAAHVVTADLYFIWRSKRGVTHRALAQMLPAARRELQWALPYVAESTDLSVVRDSLRDACEQGKSPLAAWVREHVDTEEPGLRALVRQMGGKKPCGFTSGLTRRLVSGLMTQVRGLAARAQCEVPDHFE